MGSDKQKIKYGIIGFGKYAEFRLIPAFRRSKYSELTAITKRVPEDAAKKAEEFNIPGHFSDPGKLVSDHEIDAVIICTPPAFHHEYTVLAARAGKHVMVEKPIAANAAEVKDMIRACNLHGVKMMSAFVMRFIEIIQQIRQIIRAGELGVVDCVQAHLIMDASLIDREWLSDPVISGGGPVADLGAHMIDLMTYILNRKIIEVKAIVIPSYTANQIERKATISLLFEDGIIGNLYVSFEAFRESGLTFYGSDGKLSVLNFNRVETSVPVEITRGEKKEKIVVRNANYHATMLDHFAKALLFDEKIISPGEAGLQNQLIIDKIYS